MHRCTDHRKHSVRRLAYSQVLSSQCIDVNAAGVAGVATPQYLTCRGRPVLTTPNILTSVLFFPFTGTSEYRKSLSFSSAMRPMYSFFLKFNS